MQRESSSSLRSVYPNLGYHPQTLDTCIEADVFEFALLGQKSNSGRLQMSTRLTQGARQFCIAGMQDTHPFDSVRELPEESSLVDRNTALG